MRVDRLGWRRICLVLVLGMLVALASALPASSGEFERRLARVDQALKTNPNFVPKQALYSCRDRRMKADYLNRRGQEVRANRSLTYCFNLLGISEDSVASAPDPEAEAKKAAAEKALLSGQSDFERRQVEKLKPNVANGLEVYRSCAVCHTPEGWGMSSGIVPQLAGQHRTVIIKQLADIRSGFRKNRVMAPYATIEAIGGPQAVADVAAYIDTLEISTENGRGPGKDLVLGEQLFKENCVRCHGAKGEGNDELQIPRIQSQHFGYLVTQFELIRDGERRNANPEMVAQIKNFDEKQVAAVMDYVSRLRPPAELVAPADWRNPDFMRPPATK